MQCQQCWKMLLGLSLVLSVQSVWAQEGSFIYPGHPSMDVSIIKPFKADYSSYSMTFNTQAKYAGKNIISSILILKNLSWWAADQVALDPKTLGMVFRNTGYNAFGKEFLMLNMDDNKLQAVRTPVGGGEPIYLQQKFDTGAFELMFAGYVFAAFPLSNGYNGSIPFLWHDKNNANFTVLKANFNVTGREKVKSGDNKEYNCWVVEISFMTNKEILYVSKEAPYLIKRTRFLRGGRQSHTTLISSGKLN